jgi:hypothetical protein
VAQKMNGFKVAVLASTLAFCVWFFLPFAPLQISGDVQRILNLSGYDASVSLSHPAILICSFVWRIVAMIGLFSYKKWAAPLFGGWLLMNILLSPFGGVSIYTGIETMVGYIATLSDGLVLCLSYLYIWRKNRSN